ncbi:FecCD family ABC transporter permease [Amycolatopsis anabasis]|uniref:FecCD family ABC transporter permease n=1 Tax=Amycolatopsis anabasis TaxID=1840409 RepID=UPI001C553F16|nr:iron ABC transporter permease [Amycolatopsis anabasis]
MRRGRFSVLLPRRAGLAALVLAAVLAMLGSVSIVLTTAGFAPGDTVGALFGFGHPALIALIQESRLPRIADGILAGAALGVAGCLSQTLARNRLATPDLLGVNQGAAMAVLLGVLASGTGMITGWWFGPLGAVGAAMLILLVAGGLGTRGYRVLVVGLAITVSLESVSDLILSLQGLPTAQAVFGWTIGDLSYRGYAEAIPATIGLAVLLPVALLCGRKLAVLRFGDDVARTLGLHLGAWRLGVLVMSVLLAGLAVGVSGPIAFLAMAAPIIAGRLAGPARVPILGSALVGAAITVTADTVGRVLTGSGEVPVGVVTSLLGGPLLLWILLSEK